MACYGAGSIAGGLAMIGWRPSRPLLAATTAGVLWAAPSAALAVTAPLAVVGAGAFAAGLALAVFGALWMTTIQQRIPADMMSRIMSYVVFGSFSIGPIGLALAGPVAELTSITAVLAAGVAWQVLTTVVLLALPAIREVRRLPDRSPDRAATAAVRLAG